MNKLDNIKKNLREPSNPSHDSSLQQRDRTMKNLEDVLKRQKERLDNFSNQPIVYDPSTGFQDSRNSPQSKGGNTNGTQNSNNLEKAYEDLEKEIRDIKSKLQRSMGGGGANYPPYNHYIENVNNPLANSSAQRKGGRTSFKSPSGQAQLEDNDYSLSASELNASASIYNSSNRGAGIMNTNNMTNTLLQQSQDYSAGKNVMAPKF